MRRVLAWLPLSLVVACARSEAPAPPPTNEPPTTNEPPPPVIVEVESTEHAVEETACAHLSRLEGTQADDHAVGTCVAELGQLRRDRGQDVYEAELSCLLTATDIGAATRCELVGGPALDDGARGLCRHVLAIMAKEMGDEHSPSEDELERFVDKCAEDLVKERDKLGPDHFERMSTCMLAADAIEGMLACQPEVARETSSP